MLSTLPTIGLGTYRMTETEIEQILPFAIEHCNYRLIDTANVYKNEVFIGNVLHRLIQSNSLSREDIFITSKLSPKDHGYQSTVDSVKKSLTSLQMSYIDLYLIHWPGKAGLSPSDSKHAQFRKESWQALEDCKRNGLIKNIGISNYSCEHLRELMSYAVIKPFVHQFEIHPLCFPDDVINLTKELGILIQAYSSFGEGELIKEEFLCRYSFIKDFAMLHGVSPAQILLKWALQHNFLIIPKSSNRQRVQQNIHLDFILSSEQMKMIDEIHFKECKKFCWDPSVIA